MFQLAARLPPIPPRSSHRKTTANLEILMAGHRRRYRRLLAEKLRVRRHPAHEGKAARLERLEPRQILATLYWDPDQIATNNVIATGGGLGGSGIWTGAGAAVWFNPALNGGAGGHVSWNSFVGDTAVFAGPNGFMTPTWPLRCVNRWE